MAAISMESRRSFAHTVSARFDTWWQQKLPVPIDPLTEVYRTAYTDKEWVAVRYLRQTKPDALKQVSRFGLYLVKGTESMTPNQRRYLPEIEFRFPEGVYLPEQHVHLCDLSGSVVERVKGWAEKVAHYHTLRSELRARCNGILGNPNYNQRVSSLDPGCNTLSQLYKVWPEAHPHLVPEWKQGFMQASGKTRLPPELAYRARRDGIMVNTTPAQFRCEDKHATEAEKARWTEINEILTMMAFASDLRRDDRYPTFSNLNIDKCF